MKTATQRKQKDLGAAVEEIDAYRNRAEASERALERAKEVINLKIAHKGDCIFVTEDFTGPECTCGKLDAALASPGSPQ